MQVVRPLVAALLLVAPLVPAHAATSSPELAGTTVLTATRSGYVDVEVPRDIRLSPRYDGNPDVRFSGTGRMLGVWLDPLDPDSTDSLESLRVPGFLGGGTRTWGSTDAKESCSANPLEGCTLSTPHALLLHRGHYRLTVLTDGTPVQVQLRLGGLQGSTSLRPRHLLASAQLALPARESVGTTTVTFGATGPLAGSLRTWVAATAKAPGTEVDGSSACQRQDPGAAPPFGYAPPCPGGTSGGYRYSVHTSSVGVYGLFVSDAASATDAVGLGGSFTNDQGVTLGRTLGVWLRRP